MESFHQDLSISTISIDEVIRPALEIRNLPYFEEIGFGPCSQLRKGRHSLGKLVRRRYRRASYRCGEIYRLKIERCASLKGIR